MSRLDQSLLKQVETIAHRAGEAILEIYQSSDFGIEAKADNSPLTLADRAAHQVIVDALRASTPEWPVLSEESTALPFSERSTWDRYWLVDPLDGTKEFIKRNGEFTVNIALIDAHYPVLGVVHVPVSGVTYSAAEGMGAFKQQNNAPPSPIQARTCDADSFQVVGSRSHSNEQTTRFVECLGRRFPSIDLVSIGSSLKICLVAEGKADIYPRFGPTSEWDTAAAQCVAEQAGAKLTDMAFERLAYNTKESYLNPFFLVFSGTAEPWRDCL